MQNDMRDRLVELLKKADENTSKKFIIDYEDAILDNADYLIANGVIVPPCKIVILPCNLKDEITLLNGEKRMVEYLVYDGEWHFGTENGEFNEREIINLPIEEKALKEPVPKASANNSFFYNRFMKTV